MAKARKILTAFLLTLGVACSTKYNEVKPDTVIEVFVNDEATGRAISGARVLLYDDSAAFHQTISSAAEPSGFVSSYTTDNTGAATIEKLKTNTNYFVYAYYKDTTVITGTYITLDNSARQYALKNTLADGSQTVVTISLRPSDGFIVLWTGSANSAALPIDVFVNNISAGSVTKGNSLPSLFQTGSVSQRMRAGKAIIEGKSSSGCYWTNQVTVNAGSIRYFGLTDCSVGTIAFYTDFVNTSDLPIQLTLNANDAIGTISAVVSSTPTDCSAVHLATALRETGNYTYQAVSASGNCVWSGSFMLTAGECNLIYLTKCN